MKKTIKKLIPNFLLRAFRKIRFTLNAVIRYPKYLQIEDTKISVRARNWPMWVITQSPGKIKNGKFYYEQDEMEIVRGMMAGKHVFYDIGASMGYYSYVAMAQGVWHAVAFEPVKKYADIIKEATKRQDLNIWVVNNPVGKRNQDVISDNGTAYAEKEATTIDWFGLYTGQYPDIIKIDVEGYEADVIEGGAEIIKNFKPDIILSLHREYLEAMGRDSEKLLSDLKELGYENYKPPFGGTYFLRHKNSA